MAFLLERPAVPSKKFYPAPQPAQATPSAQEEAAPAAAAPAEAPASAGPNQRAATPPMPVLSSKERANVKREHASISRVISRSLRAPLAKMSSGDYSMAQRIPNVSLGTARCVHSDMFA